MKAPRSRRDQKAYDQYVKNLPADAPCTFCALGNDDQYFISETEHFKIVRNRFPYTYWDYNIVQDHLMIVPKQHTDTLKDLSFLESKEYIEQISIYEYQGYNIYARTPGSNIKTIVHQHTHLMKFAAPVTKKSRLKMNLRIRK